ncbi:MAG: ankyrin repeat domain-containing protein [Acidobacteriota bacterium]
MSEAAAFFDAVRAGDFESVHRRLDADPALVHRHDDRHFGATALIHACGLRRLDMVDLLLERGADIDGRSDWWAGSWGVLDSGDADFADALIERGATLTVHAAARLGRLDELARLLDADPDGVHAPGGDGKQPLHFAATVEVATLLLERGADIDARDLDHVSTPAQWLALEEPEVARYLLERGARADPVLAVALGEHGALGRSLAEEGSTVRSFRIDRERFPSEEPAAGHIYLYTVGDGATLLHVAAMVDRPETVQWLADAGADLNAGGSYDDSTALHQAAWRNAADSVRALLAAGADPDVTSGAIHRNEAVGWAIVAGSADAVDALIDAGCRLRGGHIEDAAAGAEGRFRQFQAGRGDEAPRRIAERINRAARRS